MAEKQGLPEFIYEQFYALPEQMEINARGHLRLDRTEIDMIPAGLEGVYFVFMGKKPRYIAPDFKGSVIYGDFKDMDKQEIQVAKARYVAHRDMVEKPRYIHNENGSLIPCSLPTNMHIFYKPLVGYCLDLTQTSIIQKQKLGGFKEVILYPKKPVREEFPFILSQKMAHRRGR